MLDLTHLRYVIPKNKNKLKENSCETKRKTTTRR
jgi:hypothetical protein